MKKLVEIIREPDRSSTKSSVQGTIGQLSKWMQKLMSRYVTNANDLVMSPNSHQSISTPMMAPWPFAQWGLDILGPFPLGTRQMKFLVIGIDYFTKWVEAKPLASITQQNVKNFVWKNILCRFGVPKVLVSDNGWQFDNTFFRDFC